MSWTQQTFEREARQHIFKIFEKINDVPSDTWRRRVHIILYENLNMKKLFSEWMHCVCNNKGTKAPCYRSMAVMAKLHECIFKLPPHPPHSLDLAAATIICLQIKKRMLRIKKFDTNEKMTVDTEAYLQSLHKSCCKRSIEMLENRLLKDIMLTNGDEFFSLSLMTFWSMYCFSLFTSYKFFEKAIIYEETLRCIKENLLNAPS